MRTRSALTRDVRPITDYNLNGKYFSDIINKNDKNVTKYGDALNIQKYINSKLF